MKINTQEAKRLGIYFFFDKDGVVDGYVEKMLEGILPSLSELTVVVNGQLTPSSRVKLSRYTGHVIERPNEGLDVWAYKTALDSYGWEKLADFDEVILLNSTIMGPVYPFEEMFSEMDSRDVDFWGLTWYHRYDGDPFGTLPEGYIPRHLQSHFHAYRRSLVTSKEFQRYWDEMPPIHSYIESVGMHEAPFTQRFERLGFKSDVYINTEDLEGFTYQPILFAPTKLMREQRCPIFKRRSFFHPYDDVLNQSVGTATRDLYEFLRDETDYPTELIWENLLRTTPMAHLVRNLNLNYVLPTEVELAPLPERKIALVLHIYYEDLIESVLSYARSMPESADIYVTLPRHELAPAVEKAFSVLPNKVDIRLIENRGRDVSALLIGVRDVIFDYDYVCFAHDKKTTQLKPYSIGDSFARKCFDNTLASREFVTNVIRTFEQEPRLGMMAPTPPNHADYFPVQTVFHWGPNWEPTRQLMHELKLEVPMAGNEFPVAPLGTMFWFRPEALRPLFEYPWEYESFPPEPNNIDGTVLHAVERAYGLVPQAQGYFCAWLFADSFARTELTNLAFYTQELTEALSHHWPAENEAILVRRLRSGQSIQVRVRAKAKQVLPAPLHKPAATLYRNFRSLISRLARI